VKTKQKQQKPMCKGITKFAQRCKKIISLEETYCYIHRQKMASPYYFRDMEDLWNIVKPKMKSLDRNSSGILGVNIDVTIIFSDMCGFSKTGADYSDAPHISAFVGSHFLSLLEGWAKISKDINKVFIDKFVGDQLMLVIPGERIHSIEIALNIIRTWFLAPQFYSFKVGIHWGKVWFGDIGLRTDPNRHKNFSCKTVMGQTVNIAARLCAKAQENELLLYPHEQISNVPHSIGWTFEHRVLNNGLKNIIDSSIVVGSLRHERIPIGINYSDLKKNLLEKVFLDKPESINL
jgi:class 3 adenylate cyclase